MSIICLDVGGTQLRAAYYPDESETPLRQKRINTRADIAGVTQRLDALIGSLLPEDEPIHAIAAAVPGPVNPQGHIFSAPNIPEWHNFNLKNHLQARFGVPVFIGNDANLAALGEWRYGAGRGFQDLLYLTISTGIGGGAISQGRLLCGADGLGAEFGHVPVTPDGPICSCGQPGHLEAYASGTAIASYVRGHIEQGHPSILRADEPFSAEDVAQAARQGDALALEALQRAGFYLGIALSGFVHLFNPRRIIFGGGVSRSGDLLFHAVRQTLQTRILRPVYLEKLEMIPAALGDDAGLMGALALAKQNLKGDSP